MSAVMAAKLRAAKIIIAVDLQPQRLELAKKLGATHTVLGSDPDVVAQIQKISGKNGVDYSVDCAGIPQVVEKALDCLGTRGKGATVGAPTPGVRAGVDVFSHLVMGRQYLECCEGDSDTQKVRRSLSWSGGFEANSSSSSRISLSSTPKAAFP
jgi:Zn-dependent alcohol dehydrogenase